MLKKIILLSSIICFFGCAGTIEKSWIVKDFSKPHKFSIAVDNSKSVSNVNLYLKGKFKGTIFLSTVEGDSIMKFTSKTLPEDRIFMDFYGGVYNLYLAPSDAEGELKIIIEIPYH